MSVQAPDEVRQMAATKRRAQFEALLGLTLVALLALMWIALAFSTRAFMTYGNLSNLLRQGAVVAILAIGETFVIITAGIDLSVGAVTGFSTVIIALLLGSHVPVPLAILITLICGLVIGAFHGFGIMKLGLPPFIMTLATLTAIPNIGFLITNGATIQIQNDAFSSFSTGEFLGLPNLFWMVIVVAVPAYILLHHSRYGRYLFAVGSNREAARLSGVNTVGIVYMAYMVSGLCAAFAGILTSIRLTSGSAIHGQGLELEAIASSVIGGASLFGAIGSVHGPILGSFILTTIANGANLMHVNSFWQKIITGGLIIVIVYFDGIRRKKR
jgi:ribose transport system permease protein